MGQCVGQQIACAMFSGSCLTRRWSMNSKANTILPLYVENSGRPIHWSTYFKTFILMVCWHSNDAENIWHQFVLWDLAGLGNNFHWDLSRNHRYGTEYGHILCKIATSEPPGNIWGIVMVSRHGNAVGIAGLCAENPPAHRGFLPPNDSNEKLGRWLE